MTKTISAWDVEDSPDPKKEEGDPLFNAYVRKELNRTQYLLMRIFRGRMHVWNDQFVGCTLSDSELAAQVGCQEKTIKNAISELIRTGKIRRLKGLKKERRLYIDRYRVAER